MNLSVQNIIRATLTRKGGKTILTNDKKNQIYNHKRTQGYSVEN